MGETLSAEAVRALDTLSDTADDAPSVLTRNRNKLLWPRLDHAPPLREFRIIHTLKKSRFRRITVRELCDTREEEPGDL